MVRTYTSKYDDIPDFFGSVGDRLGNIEVVADYSRAWGFYYWKESRVTGHVSAILLGSDIGTYWLLLKTGGDYYSIYEADPGGAITNSASFHEAITIEACAKWLISQTATGRLSPKRPASYDTSICYTLPTKYHISRALLRLAKVVPQITVLESSEGSDPSILARFVITHLDPDDIGTMHQENYVRINIHKDDRSYIDSIPHCSVKDMKNYLMAIWLIISELESAVQPANKKATP